MSQLCVQYCKSDVRSVSGSTCNILPPATPPFNSSTSEPGLFTSKDLMTIICGGDVKSLQTYMPDGCVCHTVHTVVMTQRCMLTVVYAPVPDIACLPDSRSDAMQICKLCLLKCQLCECVLFMRLAAVQMPCCSADLTGTGIFLTMYSQTASTLYFSCADIGTIGAPSAIVPWIND